MMLALFALIAAQAVPAMRGPAPVIVNQPPGVLHQSLAIAPDLVVKELRIEGDRSLHVLVANDGAADSPPQVAMYVKATPIGFLGPRGGSAQWLIPQLKAGTDRWITVPVLMGTSADGVPYQDISLADLSSFTVYIDPYAFPGGGPWTATNPAQFDPSLCRTPEAERLKRGCVLESNEDNNVISADKAAIAPWDSHLEVRRR